MYTPNFIKVCQKKRIELKIFFSAAEEFKKAIRKSKAELSKKTGVDEK